ncbi:hypothetical protein SK128_020948 [Halocaridina rubra]|uniref:FAM193 C-terminal domain-containing protein n=1 Tax=Halocaridina rubra TaxID=373956 RepID=A0AAN9FUP8_HALRR
MEVSQEAPKASRGAVEVGGVSAAEEEEETLAKEVVEQDALNAVTKMVLLQGNASDNEAQEYEESEIARLIVSESSLSSDSHCSDKSKMSEDGHKDVSEEVALIQENGDISENLMNGVIEKCDIHQESPGVSGTHTPFNNAFQLDGKLTEENGDDRSDDEATFEVSDLINEILHQSSYLDDGGLNGLEFVDTIPDALDAGSVDMGVTSTEGVLPVFVTRKEERPSSPDSDSNMTTASEGSSSTSQLSAASTHTSDLNAFIRSESRELLNQLITSADMSEFELKSHLDSIKDQTPTLDVENLEVLSLTVPNSTVEKLRVLDPIDGLDILEITEDSGVLEIERPPGVELVSESQSVVISNNTVSKAECCNADGRVSPSEIDNSTIHIPGTVLEGPTCAAVDSHEEIMPTVQNGINFSFAKSEDIISETVSRNVTESLEDINIENSLIKDAKFISDIGETLAALETLSLDTKVAEDNLENLVDDTVTEIGSSRKEEQIVDNHFEGKCLENGIDSASNTLPSVEERLQVPVEERATDCSGQQNYDCSCKRTEVSEEGGSVIVGVWAELRSSLRQLHRSMIPQSTQGSAHRSRPSINRIKALANMLMSHDAHQLYLRISHLAHELCIELKVRLLATIHDAPTQEDAAAFVQGVCDSYQWVMSVCEALHPALERLDSEHLSRFKLNWVTLNMHIFHSTIFTEPDVQDYINICEEKLNSSPGGEDVIGCLASLDRTLSVAENVWVRADALLQDYAVERAALSARRRQLLADWEQFKAQQQQRSHQQEQGKNEEGASQCPCSECSGSRGGAAESEMTSANSKLPLASMADIRPPSSCECHFCNSSIGAPSTEEPVLPTTSGNSLPPLAQPQLSLYPHIHSTPPGSDIVGAGQSREDMGPVPPPPTTKPPITTNPYLGSDLLTEQLMREWELVYGDALTPPGSHPILPPSDGVLPHYQGDPSNLVSGVETMHISSSRPSYTHTMVDPSIPYVPDSRTTARALTTLHPSSQASSTTFALHHPVSNTGHKVPLSSTSRSNTPVVDACCSPSSLEVPSSSIRCCSATNTTSVITHTRAHHTHATAPVQKGTCLNGLDDCITQQRLDQAEQSSSRESMGDSDTSGGDEWSSGDESDSSATVSSAHQDPHCDCCYCHMLHHKQDGGRQKYSDRRDRLLQILSRKKKARSATSGMSTPSTHSSTAVSEVPTLCTSVPTSKDANTPLGGQNINEILDFIEGNQVDEAKHAKKAAKKARQKLKRMAMRREEEEEGYDDYDDKHCDADDVEDGPLAELRRRAPDVTITVVRPGQQTPRTPASPQNSTAATPPSSRTILQPSRPSHHQSQPSTQRGRSAVAPASKDFKSGNTQDPITDPPSSGNYTGLSNILKGMEGMGKEKEKGSQMVTIRRVMDPNNAEPTVTITLKGEQPDKDKVLFKLVNGQAVSGNGGQNNQGGKRGGGKGGGSARQQQQQQRSEPKPPPLEEPPIPEGLTPEEVKKYKKKMKKERQRQRKIREQIEEQEKSRMKHLELQKQQELLRQQQEQIRQKQLQLQRQEKALIKQQQQQQNGKTKKKEKKKNSKGSNSTVSNVSVVSNSKSNKSKNKNNSDSVSAVVYDGDDVAQSYNLPPGVTINKVAGQPGMVTISNNMGGAFSQPFLPNPNVYPSPIVQGYPMQMTPGIPIPKANGGGKKQRNSLSWNSAIDGNYPDKDNVIVVDTNNSYLGMNSSPNMSLNREMTSDEKVLLAVKGVIDPSTLNMTQKKKFRKMKRSLQEEKEKAKQKQREEDDLMDQMYNIASGKSGKKDDGKSSQSQCKGQTKKTSKPKENMKPPPAQTNKQTTAGTKTGKQAQTKVENQKHKQSLESGKENGKNNKHGKDNSLQNISNQQRKNSTASNQSSKLKQQQQQQQQLKQQQQKQVSLSHQQKLQPQQQQKQKQQPKSQPSSQQKANQQTQQHKQNNQQPKQKSQHHKQTHLQQRQLQENHPVVQQNQRHSTNQPLQQSSQQKKQAIQQQMLATDLTTTNNGVGNYGSSIGYAPQGIAHEARYAQYLKANATTLAKMTHSAYNGSVSSDCSQDHYMEEDKKTCKKKKSKKGKKGHLEDMTTIDSVFTPKDNLEGELDETERDVEAFKRFCFNNTPYTGEKPKVIFNVKDIMIKKRPCNVNL